MVIYAIVIHSKIGAPDRIRTCGLCLRRGRTQQDCMSIHANVRFRPNPVPATNDTCDASSENPASPKAPGFCLAGCDCKDPSQIATKDDRQVFATVASSSKRPTLRPCRRTASFSPFARTGRSRRCRWPSRIPSARSACSGGERPDLTAPAIAATCRTCSPAVDG
jgi:hypothetical protein